MTVYCPRRISQRFKRRGAAALEFSIVAAAFLFAVLGITELGRAIMVHQALTNAAREAARRAVVPGATDADITASEADGDPFDGIIAKYLSAAHIPLTHTVTIYVNDEEGTVATASSHDRITVLVSIPYSDVSWGPLRFMPANSTLAAGVAMRKE